MAKSKFSGLKKATKWRNQKQWVKPIEKEIENHREALKGRNQLSIINYQLSIINYQLSMIEDRRMKNRNFQIDKKFN